MENSQKFSKYCLRSTLILAILLIVYMIVRRDFSQATTAEFIQFILYYIVPVISFSAICVVISFVKKPVQLTSLIYISSILFAVFSAEFYLQYITIDIVSKIKESAKERKINPDLRTIKQVVEQHSTKNNEAYPFYKLANEYKGILPLGLIPNKLTVYCNEIGEYLIFKSDRHGFNNPDSIWNKKKVDFVALGDSFTHGACIPNNKGYVNLIRENGRQIINLGIGGNNPFSNLATIVEYVLIKKPKIILWFHFSGNDLAGMMTDTNHKTFIRYIKQKEFSQNLFNRSDEIEIKMLSSYKENKNKIFEADEKTVFQKFNIIHLIKLHYLRTAFGQSRNLDGDFDFNVFEDIMRKARDLADKIGSEIYFINIPTLQQAYIYESDPNRRKTYEIIKKLDIKWLDLSNKIINHNDPSSLYAYRNKGGHFSEKGNEFTAMQVLKMIEFYEKQE